MKFNFSITKYNGKGYTGLANLGNTCFLNSCLQVLNHTYELNELFDSKLTIKEISDSELLNEWNELRTLMWKSNGIISPNKFVYGVHKLAMEQKKDIFTGWAQNDMTEFLFFMINCIHSSISRKILMKISGKPENSKDKIAIKCYNMLNEIYTNEYSEIMDIFYGIYVTVIKTVDNKKILSIKPEHYFILDIPVFSHINGELKNLYEGFDNFTEIESMSGENAWYNEKKDEKEDINKQIQFWNLPQILVISLKRFSPDGSEKLGHLVSFPLEGLDLSKYVIGYNSESFVYDLFGVCNHIGSVIGGHYTSFVKNADDIWVHYNDTSVEKIEDINEVISPMAYCLFYRKKIP
jgi:ubiquitin carboxyl-terminal hydrolase 8